MNNKVIVIASGGMDSAVLLAHHLCDGDIVRALGINYGQRHQIELQYARQMAAALKVPFEVADVSSLARLLPGSSQTDPNVAVPSGHYAAENMKTTVVANRNMILLSIALGHAIAMGFDFVSYGAHAGDHTIYPDCRPEFAEALQEAIYLCDWKRIELRAPFIKRTKADICKYGASMGVDFSKTYSCYGGDTIHCGCCGTCVERREAFYVAGVPDPTPYRPDAPTIEQLVATNWTVQP